ncbi:MAG: hypothetical protein ABI571_08440 [Actinomycetota bacterium]
MPDDLKRLLEDASAGPRRPLDMSRALERARHSRRRRRSGYGALFLAVLVPAALFSLNIEQPRRDEPAPVESSPSPSPTKSPRDPREEIEALRDQMAAVQSERAQAVIKKYQLNKHLQRALDAHNRGRADELRIEIQYMETQVVVVEYKLALLQARLEMVERRLGRSVKLCSADDLVLDLDWGAAAGSYVAEVTFKPRAEGSCRLYKDFLVELKAEGKERTIASARNFESTGPPWVVVTEAHPAHALILWGNWCKDFRGPFYYVVHPGTGALRIDIEGSAGCSGGEGTNLGITDFRRLGS